MNINVKSANREDYDRIKCWFDTHGFELLDSCVLPSIGIIVEIDSKECACAWLYQSDGACGVGFLHHLGTNPHVPENIRAIALKRGMEAIKEIALSLSIKVIFGTISNDKLLGVAQKMGWEIGSKTNHVSISWD